MGTRASIDDKRLIGTVMVPGNDVDVRVMVEEKFKWQQEEVEVGLWQVAS